MAFDKTQDSYVRLREIISERTNPIIAWIGAGLSQPAGLPSWTELRHLLCGALKKKILELPPGHERDLLDAKARVAEKEADLWAAFEVLEDELGATSFRAGVREALAPADKCAVPLGYKLLWRLPLAGMFNLNLDRLATRALSENFPGRAVVEFDGNVAGEFAHVLRRSTPFIAHLHGRKDQVSSWVLTKRSLRNLLAASGYLEVVRSCLLAKTVVFVGIAADDVAVGGHLWELRERGIDFGSHYWMTDRSDRRTYDWAARTGVQMIGYPAAEGDHSALNEMFDDLLAYLPEEEIAPPVRMAAKIPAPEELPEPEELLAKPTETVRQVLNAEANKLVSRIPSDGYGPYEEFCRKYDQAIYHAWYVTPEPPNDVLLGYKLTKEIGRGAFGEVFRATTPTGEEVALKLLHGDVRRKPEMLQSFRRGVRSMRILSESGVEGMIPYRDASEIPTFVVMDLVHGPDLREAVQAKFLEDWTSVLRVAVDLANIIRSAHRLPQRVLHRDLRPPNVMLEDYYAQPDDWRVVVLDFDLSWHLGATELSLVSQPAIHGYLAPEQVERRASVSTRNAAVDSFGLGMTLLYLRSGKEPRYLQHRDRDWQETVVDAIAAYDCSSWVSLPNRYARLVLNATQDAQRDRWDVSQIEGELEQLKEAARSPESVQSAELLAEEVACRGVRSIGGAVDYEWSADRVEARLRLVGGVELRIAAQEAERCLRASFQWASSGGHDVRKVKKYLSTRCQQAISLLRKQQWQVEAAPSLTSKSCSFSLSVSVDILRANIDAAGKALGKAIGTLRFD